MEPQTKRIKVDSVQEEPMATKGRVIDLLPAEQLLRELLLECAQHFPGLEIWITGGWVRDRLLGIPSSDLDFALSNVTGRRFGQLLEDLSARTEIEANYRQKAAANDKKAKKLETAGGKLFGLDIDLVNLRKEVYDGHSRTPEMEFGTPEEDAFRRDATINSLFFHLGKQEVVDLTGRGLEDLDAKIMRTPLDPRQTFMDDPLRVLRLIRVGLSNSSPWPATWPQASGLLGRLLKDDSILCKMIQYEANADYLWTMAAYTPFAGLRQAMLRQIVDEATMAIRAPAKISKLFESALKNFDSIRTIVDTIALQSEKSPPRSRIGMAIRSWGATWTTQVTYVMLAEAVYAAQTSSSLVTSGSSPSLDEPLLTRYSAFAGFKGGQFLKTALDGLLAWQFDHAESGIEDAKMWLLDRRESLGIPSGGGW
ncbi:poly A polymerase head domain-containing protein [Hirsutella rhossiliensis]|uniref:Poly A polymerase head domain-containing protein n=1 Tax=Hirsutella rhossiliensis TaxID=111463 RepID=A0A9P8N3X9_9HYPO|nr:poly A polymerase head domain-containing protein [Hirsutella rhossiliensis]KAH0964242.1 poly A polymerase head domain-containing protein [Hirsutella rhossiliensis]